MAIAAAKKNWNSGFKLLEMMISEEIKKPIKIPIPPSEAMGLVCILRASGRSNSFFSSATLMIGGMARKVMKKATELINSKSISIHKGFGVLTIGFMCRNFSMICFLRS